VRRDAPKDTKPDESNLNGGSSVEVAAYLRSLPNVELVMSNVTNQDSISNKLAHDRLYFSFESCFMDRDKVQYGSPLFH
jgi:hypothetical protein